MTRSSSARNRNTFGYHIPSLSVLARACHPTDLIRISLADTFRCLDIAPNASKDLIEKVILALSSSSSCVEIEHGLHELSGAVVAPNTLRAALDARARLIANQIRPHVVGRRLLDFGCGDGMVLQELDYNNYDVLLADVLNYIDPRVAFPFRLLTNGALRSINQSFDTILILTVLHHASDPTAIVSGLSGLRPKRVIVIESVIEKPLPQNTLACLLCEQDFETRFAFATFADWFYNRVLHQDVPVPYNFGRLRDWEVLFSRHGFRTTYAENLGIDQCLVPEVHQLLVYEPS